MASPSNFLLLLFLIFASSPIVLGQEMIRGRKAGSRVLMTFKETPSGGNVTYECSPSGPCVACPNSEKKDDKYRCSETGYRIPLECVELSTVMEAKGGKAQRRLFDLEDSSIKAKLNEVGHGAKETHSTMRQRSLLADSSESEHRSRAYITYRSCVPAINEEKLSVLGFEGIVLVLLMISGSFIYLRRKQNSSPLGNGAMRIPTSSRF